MTSEFYLKIDIIDKEFNALELEKIIYKALVKEIGREFDFMESKEDITVIPIDFERR